MNTLEELKDRGEAAMDETRVLIDERRRIAGDARQSVRIHDLWIGPPPDVVADDAKDRARNLL